jgi:hypothetical protein
MTGSMRPARSVRPTGKNGCAARKRSGGLCDGHAVAGTDLCRMHPGKPLEQHKAEGAVVVELSRWGISDRTLDPGVTLLQLMTQSFQRARLYGELLEEAYNAAERLQASEAAADELPPSADTQADRDRALLDLERVFNTGGVSALIGHTYAADKEGGVFATGEAIRGLVQLEAQERDRAAGMAAKAVAAGLATRQVELAERQGQLVAEVIRGVLGDLGHDLADPAVLRVVGTRLRALAGTDAA